MNRPEIKDKSINDAIKSIRISNDAVLKDVSPVTLEKEREDGRLQRLSYVAYFADSNLFGKTVGRRFWQDIESDADGSDYCVWKNSPDPDVLVTMKGTIFNVRVLTLDLHKSYIVEEKNGKPGFETTKYSSILMENEELEEVLEAMLIEKRILDVTLEEILE